MKCHVLILLINKKNTNNNANIRIKRYVSFFISIISINQYISIILNYQIIKLMKSKILITGGTGLIGTRLTELLLEKNYEVSYLSRYRQTKTSLTNHYSPITTYLWRLEDQYLENDAISNTDYIIHLAGANVVERRWTKNWKIMILASRVISGFLLLEKLKTVPHHVKAVISASAVGIYGCDTGQQLIKEDAPHGNDFLANVTKCWEIPINDINTLNIRTVKLRIGVVLSNKGGALKKMSQPIKYFAGAAIGSGEQYISWIHIDDLCNMFIKAIEDKNISGAYNAVAPFPVTNAQMTKAIAKKMHKPLLLPNIPKFVLKIIFGEMNGILVGGSKVSSSKIQQQGFQFQYSKLEEALEVCMNK